MKKEFNGKEAFEDAVVKGRVKLKRTNDHCIFCDAKQNCIEWVPQRMNRVLPVCESCLSKVCGAFKKLSGGFIWG